MWVLLLSRLEYWMIFCGRRSKVMLLYRLIVFIRLVRLRLSLLMSRIAGRRLSRL